MNDILASTTEAFRNKPWKWATEPWQMGKIWAQPKPLNFWSGASLAHRGREAVSLELVLFEIFFLFHFECSSYLLFLLYLLFPSKGRKEPGKTGSAREGPAWFEQECWEAGQTGMCCSTPRNSPNFWEAPLLNSPLKKESWRLNPHPSGQALARNFLYKMSFLQWEAMFPC